MNSRPPPPDRRRYPQNTMLSRVYSTSLRPVVIITGLISAAWSLAWAVGAFRDIDVDKDHGKPKFATQDIVLGTLYIVACVIDVFGVAAAAMQHILLVRVYSFLSILSGLCVVAAGFMRVIIHFVFKNDLIDECKQIVTGKDVLFRSGIWGPTIRDTLSPAEAEKFCNNDWNRDSWREIVSLIIELVLAGVFVMIAFAYYRQVLDPTSPANARRTPPSAQHNMAAAAQQPPAFPEHYNPPYMAYNAPFAPPAGPPPGAYGSPYAPPQGPPPEFGKPPMYTAGSDEHLRDVKDDKDDPFSDFDGTSQGKPGESRDRLV